MSHNKILSYNKKLVPIARKLRKNMTPAEVILWQNIRKRTIGYQFHRQVPIDQFIVDFYCHELMLAIEIDDLITIIQKSAFRIYSGNKKLKILAYPF